MTAWVTENDLRQAETCPSIISHLVLILAFGLLPSSFGYVDAWHSCCVDFEFLAGVHGIAGKGWPRLQEHNVPASSYMGCTVTITIMIL